MKRRDSIKTAFLLAIVFFCIRFILDVILLFCAPIRELCCPALGNDEFFKNKELSLITEVISIIALSVAILPKCILAFFNLGKTDFQRQRGLMTIILTAVFSLLSSITSVLTSLIIPAFADYKEIAMLSTMSPVRSLAGILSSAATVILYCCGTVEFYNGAERNICPPVNGDVNNTDDTLY